MRGTDPALESAAPPLAETLDEGLCALGVELAHAQRQALLDYVALLEKWNRAYNLTAIREPLRMLRLHLLDSLAVVPHLAGLPSPARVADVGSGAGLPGIPLAIARPDLEFTLIDSSQKKTAFMQQAIGELGLRNTFVQHCRVETLRAGPRFQAVISRAFAELRDFVEGAAHLCAPGARLFAMKGVLPHEEISRLGELASVREIVRLEVPEVAAQRHLLIVEPRHHLLSHA